VERSTEEGMRMTDHGGVRRVRRSSVEQRFQESGGAGDEQRADAGGFGKHGIRVQQWLATRPLKGLLISRLDGAAEAAPLQSTIHYSLSTATLLLHGPVCACSSPDRH
jgi:hypothetical protein